MVKTHRADYYIGAEFSFLILGVGVVKQIGLSVPLNFVFLEHTLNKKYELHL